MATTPPRSHQLAAGSISTAGVITPLFTCPTNKVTIVKRLTFHSVTGLALTEYCGATTGGNDYVWALKKHAAFDEELPIELDHVLEEGDVLWGLVVSLDAGNALEYYVSGSILSNP